MLKPNDLQAIHAIVETLNRAVDSDAAYQAALDKWLGVPELKSG